MDYIKICVIGAGRWGKNHMKNELKYFIDIIKGKTIDKGTLNEGLDVVKILEMATNSLTTQKLSVY